MLFHAKMYLAIVLRASKAVIPVTIRDHIQPLPSQLPESLHGDHIGHEIQTGYTIKSSIVNLYILKKYNLKSVGP
jgi:hypothetical protein